jgi:hypothetical protein
MRWMKHLALASEDEKIAVLIEQHGPEGYGMYWLLLETVAASMQPKSDACDLTYSELRWSQKLRSSVRKTRSILRSMHDLRLIVLLALPGDRQIVPLSSTDLRPISTQSTGNRLRIEVPNLLKYRDEYSEKSRHVADKVPPRVDREQIQIEREIESEPTLFPAPLAKEPETVISQSADKPHLSLAPIRQEPKRAKRSTAGTRFELNELPEDWKRWCVSELGWKTGHAEKVFLTFSDYWRSKAGSYALKADWLATWRNWCRRENDSSEAFVVNGPGHMNPGLLTD